MAWMQRGGGGNAFHALPPPVWVIGEFPVIFWLEMRLNPL